MKGNILIADDEDMIRELINITLSKEGFTCFQAASAEEGMEIINNQQLDLALLDIMMPGRSGIDLLKDIKKLTPDTTVLMITAMNDMDTALSCIHNGAEDYITKPFNLDRVLLTVKNTLEKRRLIIENKEYQANLENKVREQTEVIRTVMGEINLAYEHTLAALIRALDAREKEVGSHSERVMAYTCLLAEKAGIPEEERIIMGKGALLHDIGKIGVSDALLRKTGPLSVAEWAEMRRHPAIGAQIVRPVRPLAEAGVVEMILHHHERFDGKGYPSGLAGAAIPFGARVIALADSVSAMLQDRPYRPARTFERVVDEIRLCAGSQFDPILANVFVRNADRFLELRHGLPPEKESAPAVLETALAV